MDPVTEPGPAPVTDLGADPAVDPGVDAVVDPEADPVADPGADSGVDPVVDPGVEPGVGSGLDRKGDPSKFLKGRSLDDPIQGRPRLQVLRSGQCPTPQGPLCKRNKVHSHRRIVYWQCLQ